MKDRPFQPRPTAWQQMNDKERAHHEVLQAAAGRHSRLSYSIPSTATMWRSEVPIVYLSASLYSGEL